MIKGAWGQYVMGTFPGSREGRGAVAKENREYKDSVFVDIFYSDEDATKNLLSLYNALHGTDLQDEGVVRKVKIEDVLYKNFNNDLSCEVNRQVFVFGEHQSSVNPNIPVRYAMYAGRAYEQVLETRDRYRTRLVKIPAPEFYVFYNGKQDYPLEQELSLSDAFMVEPGSNSMELKVKVININTDKGHEILEKCRVLREYSQFIDAVRKYDKEEDAIRKAIEECISLGILEDYLKRKGSEVRNMLVAEYSYEEDMQVKQEEALQIGIEQEQGRGIGILIETCKKFGISMQDMKQELKHRYDLSPAQIAVYLERYWDRQG